MSSVAELAAEGVSDDFAVDLIVGGNCSCTFRFGFPFKEEMERFSCTILYLACRRAFSCICKLPTRDEDGEDGLEVDSLDERPRPRSRLLEGALREGVVGLGDLADVRLDEEVDLGGGCKSKEVTLSRRDLVEASDENAEVGTVSRNLKTPAE